MIQMDDFRDEQGLVDWGAYAQAARKAGQTCELCGKLLIPATGHITKCSCCAELDLDGTVAHHAYVRCPACDHKWMPGQEDDYDLLGEGENDVSCLACGHDFTVETYVEYIFTSPSRLKKVSSDNLALSEQEKP